MEIPLTAIEVERRKVADRLEALKRQHEEQAPPPELKTAPAADCTHSRPSPSTIKGQVSCQCGKVRNLPDHATRWLLGGGAPRWHTEHGELKDPMGKTTLTGTTSVAPIRSSAPVTCHGAAGCVIHPE